MEKTIQYDAKLYNDNSFDLFLELEFDDFLFDKAIMKAFEKFSIKSKLSVPDEFEVDKRFSERLKKGISIQIKEIENQLKKDGAIKKFMHYDIKSCKIKKRKKAIIHVTGVYI